MRFRRVPMMREDPVRVQDVPAIVVTMANVRERTFVIAWLPALLRQGALHRPSRHFRPCKMIFSLKWCRHRASNMLIKITCIGIRFSRTTVVTTVVTIIA